MWRPRDSDSALAAHFSAHIALYTIHSLSDTDLRRACAAITHKTGRKRPLIPTPADNDALCAHPQKWASRPRPDCAERLRLSDATLEGKPCEHNQRTRQLQGKARVPYFDAAWPAVGSGPKTAYAPSPAVPSSSVISCARVAAGRQNDAALRGAARALGWRGRAHTRPIASREAVSLPAVPIEPARRQTASRQL